MKTEINLLHIEICPGKSSWKSGKIAKICRHSQPWERSMRGQFGCCCFTTVLWTTVINEHKQYNKQRIFFWKIYWQTQMFLYSNKIRIIISALCALTQLKFLIDAMKGTQQSWLESERISWKICLNLSSTWYLINFHFKTDFFFYKNTQNPVRGFLLQFNCRPQENGYLCTPSKVHLLRCRKFYRKSLQAYQTP